MSHAAPFEVPLRAEPPDLRTAGTAHCVFDGKTRHVVRHAYTIGRERRRRDPLRRQVLVQHRGPQWIARLRLDAAAQKARAVGDAARPFDRRVAGVDDEPAHCATCCAGATDATRRLISPPEKAWIAPSTWSSKRPSP